jgi:hypothetical protein
LEIMTSGLAQPVTKPETFRSHLPAIAAAAAGTVLAAALGSLVGAAGTVAGMAIGSLVSGTCSWWAERGIRRSAAITAARAAAIRARGRPLRPGEDAALTRAAARHDRGRRHRRWAGPAALAAVAFNGCAAAVTLVEQGAGKPLSALVQGKPGHGTTLGGGRRRDRPGPPGPGAAGQHGPARRASGPGSLAIRDKSVPETVLPRSQNVWSPKLSGEEATSALPSGRNGPPVASKA